MKVVILDTDGTYFSFDKSIIDHEIGESWGIPNKNKNLNGTIFNSKNGQIIVWRTEKSGLDGTGHGRYCDRNTDKQFLKDETLNLTYDIKRECILINNFHRIIPLRKFMNYFINKNIIIVGNGLNGFQRNISNKYIDKHDIVVRINSYKIIPHITGIKTNIHFMGSTQKKFHTTDNPIYPYRNKCDFILHSENKKFIDRLYDIFTPEKPIIRFKTNKINKIIKNIFGKSHGMSGPQCLMIFIWIALKCKCNLSYIGFGNHQLHNNKQQYYWGERELSKDHAEYHNNHKFDMQYKLLKIIDYM